MSGTRTEAACLAASMAELLDDFSSARRRAKRFGLRFGGSLPPITGEEARAARKEAFDTYYNSFSRDGADKDALNAKMIAIDAAVAAFWAGRLHRPDKKDRRKLIIALLDRDGDECWLCARQMSAGSRTIEHLEPISRGGTNDPANLALAHAACNHQLGDMSLARKLAVRESVRRERAA